MTKSAFVKKTYICDFQDVLHAHFAIETAYQYLKKKCDQLLSFTEKYQN